MISVVTCYKSRTQQSLQEQNVAKTVGTEHEVIAIDGSAPAVNVAAAYNRAALAARGNLVVFIADDCFFMNELWGKALIAKFSADQGLGIAGIAGTQYLFADRSSWTAAGRPYVKGRILYHPENDEFFAVVFSADRHDTPVVVCDGCFMAVRKSLFDEYRFDEETFLGRYFYDLEFCLKVRSSASVIVTSEVTVSKRHQPVFDKGWREAGEEFLRKNWAILPASCADSVPDPGKIVPSAVVDLKGKASSRIIC